MSAGKGDGKPAHCDLITGQPHIGRSHNRFTEGVINPTITLRRCCVIRHSQGLYCKVLLLMFPHSLGTKSLQKHLSSPSR